MATREVINDFDPVKFSVEENEYLYKQLGKPPVVALRELGPKVNPNAVRPILERVYELNELQSHKNIPWVGVEKLKDAISVYLTQYEKWSVDKRRGRPRFPSMHSYDTKGRPHMQGPGSDSGQVRTYFGANGERLPFSVALFEGGEARWTPDWIDAVEVAKPVAPLVVNGEANRIECPICGHTESFKAESRSSYNAARGRISKHLRQSTVSPEAHREVHTNEFGN